MADDSETNVVMGAPQNDNPLLIARYVAEVELYDRETQKWDRQSKRIIKRYKDDRGGDGTIESQERRFNVLWSNTQNLLPALDARNPKPDIQRRFKDADPIGRVASDVLERSVSYFCDTDLFAGTSRQCVLDYVLPGRGTLWVRYVPHFKPAEEITDDIGPGDAQGEQALAPEVIEYEEVIPDYVHREDFGHNVARTWEEVWVGWRKVYLTRKELTQRFGEEKGRLPPLDYKQQDLTGKVIDDGTAKSVIYEAWDKTRRVAVWFHKTIPHALDERPDPLKLEHFFPFPKPLLANLANDSLIPVPDYVEYQDQAAELDNLTARIAQITKNLKVAGVYDASAEGLNRMFNEGTENELIPVQQWALFAEKGGMNGAMALLPLKDIAAALISLYEARDKVKMDLDEITGMSDIVRGTTDPNETASAQHLKSAYANQRIGDRQRDVQRFIRETIRIMVDVIANHFQIETIKQISGVRLLTNEEKQSYQAAQVPQMVHNGSPPMDGQPPLPPPQPPPLPPNVTKDQMDDMLQNPTWDDVEALIRNQAVRCFRIDIETDSIIKSDEEADKQSRIEFVKAIGEYLRAVIPAAQETPELLPFFCQGLMFLARGFPVGKEFEATLNAAIQKLEKAAANPQPKPNPEMMKVQGEQQLAQQKQQFEQQHQQAQLAGEMQLETVRAQATAQAEAAKAQSQAQVQQHLNELENQRRMAELEGERQLAQFKIESEGSIILQKAHIDAAARIEVARITAKASDGAAAEARESAGE